MDAVIPTLKKGDFGLRFELPEQRTSVRTDVKAANLRADPTRNESVRGGFPFRTAKEEFRHEEYLKSQCEPFRVLIHRAANHWWVYKQYERVDTLFKMENFRAKIQHLATMPEVLLAEGDLVAIHDHLSVMSVLSHEEERKRELRGVSGGGFVPGMRSMRVRSVPDTFLAAYAREKLTQPSLVLPSLFEKRVEFAAFVRTHLAAWEGRVAREGHDALGTRVAKFLRDHKEFVQARREMRLPNQLQTDLWRLIPSRRKMANDILLLPRVTPADLLSELCELPPWFGFHYFPMRSCSPKPFTLIVQEGQIGVRDGGRKRVLRVRPSRYTYPTQPFRVVDRAKIEHNQTVLLVHTPLTRRPPSCGSESGLSTISHMSTATTSPLSWCQDWELQAPHEDYEHRLAEASIPNEHLSHRLGIKEMRVRYNNEVNVRLNAIISDCDAVRDLLFLNNRLHPAVSYACERERRRVPLDAPGNLDWLRRVEERLKELMVLGTNMTLEERKDFEALAFAKLRYEPVLKAYEKEMSQEGCYRDELGVPSAHAKEASQSTPFNRNSLSINEAWIRAVECGTFPMDTLTLLRVLLSDRDAALPDSDCSNLMLIPRCDRITKHRLGNPMPKFYLTHVQSKLFVFLFLALMVVGVFGFFIHLFTFQNVKEFTHRCPAIHPSPVEQLPWFTDLQAFRKAFHVE